jgi:hypothetical protein
MANDEYANSAHEKRYGWQRIDPIGDVPGEYRSAKGALLMSILFVPKVPTFHIPFALLSGERVTHKLTTSIQLKRCSEPGGHGV